MLSVLVLLLSSLGVSGVTGTSGASTLSSDPLPFPGLFIFPELSLPESSGFSGILGLSGSSGLPGVVGSSGFSGFIGLDGSNYTIFILTFTVIVLVLVAPLLSVTI